MWQDEKLSRLAFVTLAESAEKKDGEWILLWLVFEMSTLIPLVPLLVEFVFSHSKAILLLLLCSLIHHLTCDSRLHNRLSRAADTHIHS